MNPFILSPTDRLAHWKSFRKTLPRFPEAEQMKQVVEYWALPPLMTFAYDPEVPNSWGTPWEMIDEGNWCRNSVAIGMEFTLRLSGWDAKRLKLRYWKDYDISDLILVLQIDDKWLLNYSYRSVVELPNTRHDIICEWQFSDDIYR
jgi:hypothetical protein